MATQELASTAQLLRALGDETRLRLVALLCHGELCVCHLVSAVELPPSTVSRQLGVLRQAGLVDTRREGTWIFYRLRSQGGALDRSVWQALCASFRANNKLRIETDDLRRAQGPDSCRQKADSQ